MKRALILFTVLLLSISFVSAVQSPREGAEVIVYTVIDILEPLAGALFGGFGSEYLLESVLFFVVLLAFVHLILGRLDLFYEKKKIVWVVSVAVALLSTRFTAEWAWVQFVLLPYSILGVALLSIIPFVIYFSFVYSFNEGTIRKVSWAVFITVYVGLWYTQFDQMGDIAYIYLFAGILGFIMILTDKYIRGWIVRSAIAKGLDDQDVLKIMDFRKDRDRALERLRNAKTPQEMKTINQDLDRINKAMRALSRHEH